MNTNEMQQEKIPLEDQRKLLSSADATLKFNRPQNTADLCIPI